MAQRHQPRAIHSGPGSEFEMVGTLATGPAARVIGDMQENWMPIACPDGGTGDCWVFWDWKVLFSYQGLPLTLTVPDPASLEIVMTRTAVSPDGRWQADISRTETTYSGDGWAQFFYVELKVASLEDDATWIPVSEWHTGGLGEEDAPELYHWSADGRYLYYTSPSYPDGACAYYDNIGGYLDRLNLNNGSVAAFLPPLARGILTLSPDETLIAYLSGRSNLVVRELAAAYDDGLASQDLIMWEMPLDLAQYGQISQIAWSPDGQTVLVSADHRLEGCEVDGRSTWELDVASGVLTAITTFVPLMPTPTTAVYPPILLTETMPFTHTAHGYTLQYPVGFYPAQNLGIESATLLATHPNAEDHVAPITHQDFGSLSW
ncbi:MAG: SH3 domain-containing protein [Anaerolineae bacterium]|nr:SH3 domain-containing protein [Anaerolineae bacterium]